ncbi:hypothetical protein ACFPOE_14910 [Caenimonas terrae]|uniref:Integral membrane protein n=1 Tax=Caenimonas terrae TaxID=696074 RepID=A0ABW0NFW7_9BURK
MALLSSPRFLRNVLLADALSCVACGLLQVALTRPLESLLKLPAPLLLATGWFLLAYAGVVAAIATRSPIPRAPVWLLVAGNVGWALACVALLATGAAAPSALGTAWVLAQAATVAVLAQLQAMALRRPTPQAGWA